MGDRKTNEIIEEQRRARKEFLKLKQMQNGEVKPEPKPSEVAFVPRTFGEKASNFWFHYKAGVIGIVISVILLAVLVSQCMSRVNYDLEILYFTYTPTLDAQTEKMADYFEQYATDVNGDGEVNVTVLNCSLSKNNRDIQYRNTILTKVQTVLAGNEKSLLIIADPESVEYFNNIKMKGSFFEGEGFKLENEFYEACKIENVTKELPQNFSIYLRRVSGTVLGKDKDVEKYFTASKKLLEQLKK